MTYSVVQAGSGVGRGLLLGLGLGMGSSLGLGMGSSLGLSVGLTDTCGLHKGWGSRGHARCRAAAATMAIRIDAI